MRIKILLISTLFCFALFGQMSKNVGLFQITSTIPTDYVAYYPFNGNANDESGNGWNGTVDGAVLDTGRTGSVNDSYSFDGVNDEITTSLLFNSFTELSVSIWVYPLSTAGYRTLWSNRETTACNGEALYYSLSANEVSVRIGGTLSEQATADITNDWVHFVVVFGSNTVKIYKNNIEIQNTALTTTIKGDEGFTIGSYSGCTTSGSGVYFNGKIDDVFIYDRALTVDEVSNLFNE